MKTLRDIWKEDVAPDLGPFSAGIATEDPWNVLRATNMGSVIEGLSRDEAPSHHPWRRVGRMVGTTAGALGANLTLRPVVKAIVSATLNTVGVNAPLAKSLGMSLGMGAVQTAAAFGGRDVVSRIYDHFKKPTEATIVHTKAAAFNYGNLGMAALKSSLIPAAVSAGVGALTADPGHRMEGALQAGALGGITGAAAGGLHYGAMNGNSSLAKGYQRGLGGDLRNMANTARDYVGVDPVKNKAWDKAYMAGKHAALAQYIY